MNAEIVVAAARGWLGTPYRHRAATRGAGCDCLGLLRGVWRELYGTEPRPVPNYRADFRDPEHAGALEAAARELLLPTDDVAAGCVLLFRLHRGLPPLHCGIALSKDRFLHAQERLGVVEASLSDSWRRRVAGVFVFPDV